MKSLTETDTLAVGTRVETHLGDIGTLKGRDLLRVNHFVIEMDNSEDTHPVKRWLGNMTESYHFSEFNILP